MGLLKRAFGLDVWNVGITRDLDRLMGGEGWGEIHWRADPGPTRFLADPVGCYTDEQGEDRLLVEELSHWTNRGRIVSVPLGEGFADAPVRAEIEGPEHLSYPFVQEAKGKLHLFPECGTSGRLRRFVRANGGWAEDVAGLIDGPIIDPTFWQHEGVWYLFHTRANAQPNEQLFLLAAPDLDGPWTPHPAFPQMIGTAGARPAGPLFVWRERLFRPSQDCTTDYGGSVILNEIETLTPQDWRESFYCRLDPPPGRYDQGVHSFLVLGDRIVVDARRVAYVPIAPVIKARNVMRVLAR